MLDTHYLTVHQDVAHSHHHEVHEHRAPTDASVKLLAEMEKAALDRILSSVRLDPCEVSCVVHHMFDHMSMSDKYIIQYQLGSGRYRVEHSLTLFGSRTEESVATELRDALAKDIASKLLSRITIWRGLSD
jgi:hypothetical protein